MKTNSVNGILFLADKPDCQLDYLGVFPDGVFDGRYGKIEVTPDEAMAHNKRLDEEMVKNIAGWEVGDGCMMRVSAYEVTTNNGVRVATANRSGGFYTFDVAGNVYEAEDRGDEKVYFKRTS